MVIIFPFVGGGVMISEEWSLDGGLLRIPSEQRTLKLHYFYLFVFALKDVCPCPE